MCKQCNSEINEAKLRKIFVAVPLRGNSAELDGLPHCANCAKCGYNTDKSKVKVPKLNIRHGV